MNSKALVFLLLAAAVVHAAPPGLASADLREIRTVGDVRLSPDGRRIAYTVSRRDEPGFPSSRVFIHDLDKGTSQPLAGGAVRGPRWSPDGKRIAYFGHGGLSVARIGAQGEPLFLTEAPGTNHPLPSTGERIAWSPDGKAIAFVAATPGPEPRGPDDDPAVITRYLYKPATGGYRRFNDNRRTHIFVVDIETRKTRQLTRGDYYEHSIEWSPDGERILFVSNREPDPDRVFNYDIFTVAVSSGEISRLLSTESAEYRPRFSPDGRWIAYQGTRRGLTSSETTMEDTHIWVMNATGGKRRELGAEIDNRQGAPEWSPDGRFVYFTVQERGSVRLCRLPLAGGPAEVVAGEPGRVGRWSIAGAGTVACSFSSPSQPAELFLKTAGNSRQLTHLNRELLSRRTLAKVESMEFQSFDGRKIEAFLTHPLGRKPGSKHPLIALVKGGPHSQQGPAFDFTAQVYAAHGYATLMVNYRGSTGYGQELADAIFRDQSGGEARDVVLGVRAAVRRHRWIDPRRLGIQGVSYGGQLANWIITQTPMFRAAIPIAGIANLVSFNYMAYYHDYLAVEFGEYPHQGDLMDVLWRRSPLRHVARVRTPVMLVHGENDNDVPIAEAEQYYIALQDAGVETIMVRYPREGHGIGETNHRIDLIERSIAWYEKHFATP